MSGNTITQSVTPASVTLGRAARDLGLKRGELDLAVHLGCVRTIRDDGGGGCRISRAEIDRLCSADGFPEALRARVEAVGTKEGAAVMGVSPGRFTRLARLGMVVPVNFYLNRYRAVVWLYLAEELRQFAAGVENAQLLGGRTPEGLRGQLDAGLDLRPRNWRGRHMGFLLRQAEDAWTRAAVVASLLDPVQVAEIVQDPYERDHLNRIRPQKTAHGTPDSPAAGIAARIMTAADPDEIGWLRADLKGMAAEARRHRPVPRPSSVVADERPPESIAPQPITASEGPERSRGLLGWLRRRNS